MIGPGTGIAPFRGFIQQRAFLKKEGLDFAVFLMIFSASLLKGAAIGSTVLYYGCRRRSEDYLYREELENWLADGVLTQLHVAFSREQEQKKYVQHLMLENKKSFWNLLERGSYVYVCGDARNMARDVQATLIHIISEEHKVSMDEAAAYVKQMEVQKRYQTDVWGT
ncbi:NAD binding 1 domain containing protein [Trichuris trichiura]|uniref:NADPH--hemoprotein reductase n=1 Tax=Trichuris trichiura TaxID=36087 RepID=A0A077ZJE1_TRITR|nr:NAD binding 1 domain containing protein [Trichuris trichiura]